MRASLCSHKMPNLFALFFTQTRQDFHHLGRKRVTLLWHVWPTCQFIFVTVQALVGAFGEARIKFKLRGMAWPFCTTPSSVLYLSSQSRRLSLSTPRHPDDDLFPHAMSASSGSGKGIMTRPLLIQSGSIRVSIRFSSVGMRADGWDWRNREGSR